MSVSRIKAVILDMDGTILNTVEDIGACINRAKEMNSVSTGAYAPADYTAAIGGGIRNAIRLTMPEGCTEEQYQNTVRDYLELYPKNCTVHTKPYPGIPQALAAFRAAGLRLAVITNKTERTAQLMAASFFPEDTFTFVWGNDLVRPLKPAAAAGLAACEKLGLTPAEIAYVGDSGSTDMRFGKASGFWTIGVSWGYRSRQDLLDGGADAVCDTADALQALILGESPGTEPHR